ncbi:Elongation of very long chain fatty acids protein 6-like [Oopsacas minuta]|uniref:Elongation of very long chain fatty acids protein n=1 Tax=Oopsacas minuta TaxID=111878 RepID=A0AAV7K6U0_9METZ|nr:Elongation of very long chain fatty acids protein 6-like [Oopsacas minuta]
MEFLRSIEDQFDVENAFPWMRKNFRFSIYASIFYIISILLLQRYMNTHKRIDLRFSLSVWSFLLAIYSTVGAYYNICYLVPKIWNDGIKSAACDEIYIRNQTGLWLFLFILSKVPELVDTYFIIFRKGPLIFLHWYHHATVLIYCWFSYSQRAVVSILFSAVNYFVHAIMYMYYGLKARQVNIPRQINVIITSLQIVQMVFGLYMGGVMVMNQDELKPCGVSSILIFVTIGMYTSYFILFAIFFYDTYIAVKKKPVIIQKAHTNGVEIKPVLNNHQDLTELQRHS